MSEDITFLSATELQEAYAAKRLSPVEVVDVALARIEQLQPALNSFVTVCADDARNAAKEAEKALLDGDGVGPLTGGGGVMLRLGVSF